MSILAGKTFGKIMNNIVDKSENSDIIGNMENLKIE